MKKQIGSFPDARQEMEQLAALEGNSAALIAQLAENNAKMGESIAALHRFFGGTPVTAKETKSKRGGKSSARTSTASTVSPSNIVTLHPSGFRSKADPRLPATMIERVLVIMRDLGRPVLPKQVTTEYLLREWPLPKKGTIYNLISGTVAYLYQRKGVLVRTPTGYTLPHDNIQAMLDAPVKDYVKAADRKTSTVPEPSQPELPNLPNPGKQASG